MLKATNLLPVIEVGSYRRTSERFQDSEPWTMAFVYTPNGEDDCVVQGMSKEVETYIRQHFPKAIWSYTYWLNGKSRGGWNSTHDIYMFHRHVGKNGRRSLEKGSKQRWEISVYENSKLIFQAIFRRVPHKWLPIYDKASVKQD